uniref:ABC transmembrane type-1 domain-containing protein n=1 Tax=Meloidogyne javanica TaxID=6303 RepID=A0A915MYR1_MELJA
MGLYIVKSLSRYSNLDSTSPYHPLLNNSDNLNINNVGTSSNFSSLNGHQQTSNLLPLRVSTWEHIRYLLGYCLYVWNWLLVGFLFLVIYASARVFVPLYTAQTMSATISTNVNILLRNGLMVIGSVVFMMGMSWRLTLLTVIVIPPITFFTKLYSSYYDSLSEKTQKTKSDANRVAEEVIGCMRNIRAFASEQKEKDRFGWHLFRTLEINKKKSMALAGFQWVNEFANNCILVAILSYGGHLVLSGRMTADQMLAFMLYQLQLGENFYMLNSVGTSLMECVGASRKVFEYIKREPKIKLDKGELMPEKVLGKIEFCQVGFSYPTRPNTHVLKDLSFSILPGEVVALVGPSGAGKSSIIALLEHFYEPLFGQILLDDYPIEQYEHRYFHKIVRLIFNLKSSCFRFR